MDKITPKNTKKEQKSDKFPKEFDIPQKENGKILSKEDIHKMIGVKKKTKKQKKILMIESLKLQLGIVTLACKQVGISRETHYKWMREDPKYEKKVKEAKYSVKDFGEHALLKLIKEGNQAAIIFFNKTRNRDRGYTETRDYNIKSNQIRIIVEDPYENNKMETKQEAKSSTNNSK